MKMVEGVRSQVSGNDQVIVEEEEVIKSSVVLLERLFRLASLACNDNVL